MPEEKIFKNAFITDIGVQVVVSYKLIPILESPDECKIDFIDVCDYYTGQPMKLTEKEQKRFYDEL